MVQFVFARNGVFYDMSDGVWKTYPGLSAVYGAMRIWVLNNVTSVALLVTRQSTNFPSPTITRRAMRGGGSGGEVGRGEGQTAGLWWPNPYAPQINSPPLAAWRLVMERRLGPCLAPVAFRRAVTTPRGARFSRWQSILTLCRLMPPLP